MPIRTARVQDRSRRDYLVRKGAEALALGQRAEALARYRTALEYDAEDDRLRAAVAEIAMSLGEARAAAAELARILTARPADADSWNLLGVLLMENGERGDAARCWRRALGLAPGFELPARNLEKAGSFPKAKGRPPLLARAESEPLFARRDPRLTVCVLARDEEDLLPGCLDSVARAAFETVVIDTGSTDRTVEIARSKGARVYGHVWKDDFAAARNDALKRAHGDWVLMIDADERLDERDLGALRTVMESGEADYTSVSIESVIGSEILASRAVRLFRNYPSLSFVGRIHEQLGGSLRPLAERFGLRGGAASVRLRHLGYDPQHFVTRGKAERNARLLEAELAENPGNAYALLKHGEALFSQGRFPEASGPIEQAWGLTKEAVFPGGDRALLEEPATLLAACSVADGQYHKALETLEELHRHAAPTANTRYLEGVARWALGKEDAAPLLEEAIAAADRDGEIFTLPEIRGATPLYILGAIALGTGDAGAARGRFTQALERDPAHREARLGLAEALYQEGRPEGSVALLARLLEENAADLPAWQAGGVYLVSTHGREQAADAWLGAALTAFPGDPLLQRLRSELTTSAGAA